VASESSCSLRLVRVPGLTVARIEPGPVPDVPALLSLSADDNEEAERSFHHALEVARQQNYEPRSH
jgi:hypothetical protein